MSTLKTMQIAQVIPCTEAEGPGKRFAVWFQGCPLRCPGCCNPEYLTFRGGQSMTLNEMTDAIINAQRQGIEGLSLLGGEPFAHAADAAELAHFARQRGLSVMVYSGYTLEEIRDFPGPNASELLAHTDVLVDGRYLREQPDTERRWIGSTNQRVHLLSDRYRPDDPCWRQRNTLEIRVVGQMLTVNGFPASEAAGLWKGFQWKR